MSDDSKAAFPRKRSIHGYAHIENDETLHDPPQDGMTLREYYAGQALAGVIAAPNSPAGDWPQCAEHARKAADALIAELRKDTP